MSTSLIQSLSPLLTVSILQSRISVDLRSKEGSNLVNREVSQWIGISRHTSKGPRLPIHSGPKLQWTPRRSVPKILDNDLHVIFLFRQWET